MRVVIPLPSTDFDPTESAVPWRVLTEAGHDVVFATPNGEPAAADDRMLSGRGLLFWSPILRARRDAIDLYRQMETSHAFQNPISWANLSDQTFDGVVLAGGHAPGMKPYLESREIQALAVEMFREQKPVGAICHGVIVLARAIDPVTERSVLHGKKSTALTKSMEMSAFAMTALWLGRYYRTYDETVQGEVSDALGDRSLFEEGPFAVFRDSPENLSRGFCVVDDNYVSARWPGDAYKFSTEFLTLISRS